MALWVSGQGIPGFWSKLIRCLMSFGVYTDSGKLRTKSRKKRVQEVGRRFIIRLPLKSYSSMTAMPHAWSSQGIRCFHQETSGIIKAVWYHRAGSWLRRGYIHDQIMDGDINHWLCREQFSPYRLTLWWVWYACVDAWIHLYIYGIFIKQPVLNVLMKQCGHSLNNWQNISQENSSNIVFKANLILFPKSNQEILICYLQNK